ncbi:hypothetical protein [Foetidibacter luteolus]|uniref:hypothetical protein n=1 Tax=Foetidibacter luteolus TaxID=2608880 RepID=UPI00129A38B3|nr:hypothetical protein [Foetidibacter luteolus]
MRSLEVKFLFDGVLFTTPIYILNSSAENRRVEFFVTFSTKYLIKEYGRSYKMVYENNRFTPIFSEKQKERELIRSIQDAIKSHPETLLVA